MNEKKILIFEDDWMSIKGSFDLANIFAFEEKLKFQRVSKSQDIQFANWRSIYCMVFVDITLAKNTAMDGYNIVKRIKDLDLFDLNKVVVMTGNSKVEDNLKSLDIDTKSLKILYKPVAFNELAEIIKDVIEL